MVSEEDDGGAPKRKAREDDNEAEDCLTTIGKIPKIDREFSTSTLLQKLSKGGEKLDLDKIDGIGESDGSRSRSRTTSEYIPTKIVLESSSVSLPSTPAKARRRMLSLSDSAPLHHRSLLGSFTESALTGRLEPVKILEGFRLQLAASGPNFTSPHKVLPVTVYFFDLNTTGCAYFPAAPVPYLGKCDLAVNYRLPNKGMLQATLFNPQNTVVKLFLSNYNLEDMPPNRKTFIRHVWQWKVKHDGKEDSGEGGSASKSNDHKPSGSGKNMQHLIHYRICSDRRSRVFLHSDIRILFSQDSTRDALLLPSSSTSNETCSYELADHIEMPSNPKYSHK